jgi:hypothetical protein
MHSIKNISEKNKIDTQSRADAYNRRKRLIVRVIIIFKVWMHLKVFLKKNHWAGFKKKQKKHRFFPTLQGVPRGRHARRHQGHAGGSARQQDQVSSQP